jgi:hypothetical protein
MNNECIGRASPMFSSREQNIKELPLVPSCDVIRSRWSVCERLWIGESHQVILCNADNALSTVGTNMHPPVQTNVRLFGTRQKTCYKLSRYRRHVAQDDPAETTLHEMDHIRGMAYKCTKRAARAAERVHPVGQFLPSHPNQV